VVIRVTFMPPGPPEGGRTVSLPPEISLLRMSLRADAGIPFRCGGGICGTCRCRIEQGREHAAPATPQERRHLTEAELAAGYRLACQTFLRGDATVSWGVDAPPATPA
jgi:ferredoxin